MDNYFFLLSQEFDLRIKQAKEFIKNHNPSLGAFNEEILRKFLKDHLPKWVDVAQGFILSKNGTLSNQCDIIVYNSTYYAPLYKVNDLVIVPPESVIHTIEVKTRINQIVLHEQFPKIKILKEICPKAEASIFIYYPPKWEKVIEYLTKFDFSNFTEMHLPDKIYAFNSFCLSKENIITNNKKGVGYLYMSFANSKKQNALFEHFFYDIYRRIEIQINKDLKEGIDNVWEIKENTVDIHGRLGYAKSSTSEIEYGTIIFEKDIGEKLPPT
jgi:hypothetical protein